MPLKILIVDDNQNNIRSLIAALDNKNAEFAVANSGVDALSILTKENDFDLALLDIQMPQMDGYELASAMRSVNKTKNIPIIFITANPHCSYSEFKGYDLGAIDFIFKPVNIKMLQSKINVFERLKTKRTHLGEKIKELEVAKKQLEASEKRAREADTLKSNFLAHMSHEIRTPITAVKGFAEVLMPMLADQKQAAEYVEIIVRNSNHLLDIVNDILDLSKVEAGQLELFSKHVNISTVVEEVFDIMNALAQKKKIHLKYERDSAEELICYADPLRLKQIILNLVSNAIKFSNQGEVIVSAVKSESISLFVKDNGIGIDQSKLDLLFQPFSQLSSPSAHFNGTGLGLSLSRQLATQMGGQLYLKESTLGQGSIFALEIPAGSKEDVEMNALKKSANFESKFLENKTVLMADDCVDNQILVEHFLSKFGAQVHSVENGQVAFEKIKDTRYTPDVILMDYKMPILDGISTTKRLREIGCTVPIILLTADAMKGEKEELLKHGATKYVSKPINWDELLTSIEELMP